jgi:hypothetical protein
MNVRRSLGPLAPSEPRRNLGPSDARRVRRGPFMDDITTASATEATTGRRADPTG